MANKNKQARSEEGLSLATVMVIAIVSLLWLDALFTTIMPSFNRVREVKIKTALRAASETAMDWAAAELSNNANTIDPGNGYGTSKQSTVPTNVLGNVGYPITAIVTVTNIQPTFATSPSYDANANPPMTNSYLYDSSLDKDMNNNNGINRWRLVTTTAITGNRTATVRCVLKPVSFTLPPPPGAITAQDGVTAHGNPLIRHGDSDANQDSIRDNPVNFTDTPVDDDAGPNYDGDISVGERDEKNPASNFIIFNGPKSTVGGDIKLMPGGTYAPPGLVTGSTNVNYNGTEFPEIPPVPGDAQLISDPISKAYSFKSAGNYYFDSNLSTTPIKGGPIDIPASATPANPVRIFIESNANPAIQLTGKNGIFNNTGLPGALQIYVRGHGDVRLMGNADFNGVIYAPHSHITIGGTGSVFGAGTSVFGAIIGNQVTINGTVGSVNYDEDLARRPLIPPSAGPNKQVVSWQEL